MLKSEGGLNPRGVGIQGQHNELPTDYGDYKNTREMIERERKQHEAMS